MERFLAEQSPPLSGEVTISGAKNASLPIIAASLLTKETTEYEGVPRLSDISVLLEMVKCYGGKVNWSRDLLKIDCSEVAYCEVTFDLVSRLRASFLVMGPLLARVGEVYLALPGGCAIGTRPIDLHLKGMRALGADIELSHGYVRARTDRLIGNVIYLDFPSVGATENIMMAATLAKGRTVIYNAAAEPEIVDLANMLNAMGAHVRGAGTDAVRIDGARALHGCQYKPIPDRIEAGTIMLCCAAVGGEVMINDAQSAHLRALEAKLREMGVTVESREDGIFVRSKLPLRATNIKTLPYPGFPTDLQAQALAVLCLAQGTSVIHETIFENRFMHVGELVRMGANIRIEGRTAVVTGVEGLSGARVHASDLRAGASLVIAGLCAQGQTLIEGVEHIDRGYDRLEEKLRKLGAPIRRVMERT